MLRECNISSMQQIWRYSSQHLADTHLELKCTCYVCVHHRGKYSNARRSRNLSGGRALSRHFFTQVTWEGSRKLIEIRVLSAFLGYVIVICPAGLAEALGP